MAGQNPPLSGRTVTSGARREYVSDRRRIESIEEWCRNSNTPLALFDAKRLGALFLWHYDNG
jgi:hypothetical protein